MGVSLRVGDTLGMGFSLRVGYKAETWKDVATGGGSPHHSASVFTKRRYRLNPSVATLDSEAGCRSDGGTPAALRPSQILFSLT